MPSLLLHSTAARHWLYADVEASIVFPTPQLRCLLVDINSYQRLIAVWCWRQRCFLAQLSCRKLISSTAHCLWMSLCHNKLSLQTLGGKNMYVSRTAITVCLLSIFELMYITSSHPIITISLSHTHMHAHTHISAVFITVLPIHTVAARKLTENLKYFVDHLGSHWSTTLRYFSTSWKEKSRSF